MAILILKLQKFDYHPIVNTSICQSFRKWVLNCHYFQTMHKHVYFQKVAFVEKGLYHFVYKMCTVLLNIHNGKKK